MAALWVSLDKLYSGKWSKNHGVVKPGNIPEDFNYLCSLIEKNGITKHQAKACITSFESEEREWPPNVTQIIARCKQSTAEVQAQHRELGKDFEVAKWVGDRRVSKQTVARDLAKLRQKLRA